MGANILEFNDDCAFSDMWLSRRQRDACGDDAFIRVRVCMLWVAELYCVTAKKSMGMSFFLGKKIIIWVSS